MRRGGGWRRLRRLVLIVIALALLPPVAIVVDGLTDNARRSDVGVVLGSKVNPDGVVSRRLKARLDKAAELYADGLFPAVIVSGAVGQEGHDEAKVMKAYLVARGVPEAAVIVDSAGVNTMATARNSAALMRERGWKSALVVSQYFHISRTRLAFKQQGVSPVYSAHGELFEARDLYSIPREVVGYASYLANLR